MNLNADGSFSYTHTASDTTSDNFTYQASDGQGGTDTATVSITVQSSSPPQSIVLDVVDGWDQKNEKTLVDDDETYTVLTSDDEWWETEAEFFTSYEFQRTVPAAATIQSVKIYIEHWEEEGLSAGSIQWEVGTGLLKSPASLATQMAPLHFSEEAEATDIWDVSTVVTTAAQLNDLKVVVRNSDIEGKKTLLDRVWVEVVYN